MQAKRVIREAPMATIVDQFMSLARVYSQESLKGTIEQQDLVAKNTRDNVSSYSKKQVAYVCTYIIVVQECGWHTNIP